MRRVRWQFLLLALMCVVVAPRFFTPAHRGATPAQTRSAVPARPAVSSAAPGPASAPPTASAAGSSPQAFVRRLRCSQHHFFLTHAAPAGIVTLLCAGKESEALRILVPLAQAGDRGAQAALAWLTQCNSGDHTSPPEHRERMLDLARRREATPETLERLDALLTQEQSPSEADLASCRQAKAAFLELQPGLLQEAVDVFGRSLTQLRGESEQDLRIEYDRKTLAPGDAEGQARLAADLLAQGSSENQAEALALLRAAADHSARAASELAVCELQGCPTPAADQLEAQQLLSEAAEAGDLQALSLLSAPTPGAIDAQLPAAERSAWAEFKERLDQEGCFGGAAYAAWAARPPATPLSLSPADAELAQARAAQLISQFLAPLRQQLGCD